MEKQTNIILGKGGKIPEGISYETAMKIWKKELKSTNIKIMRNLIKKSNKVK